MNWSSLSSRQRTAIKITGYVLWGLFLTVIFIALRFPSGRVKELSQAELSFALNKDVKIEDAGVYRLSGVDLRGVDFYSRGGFAQPLLRLKRQRIRLSLLPYLLGRRDLFAITEPEGGGDLETHFVASSSRVKINMEFDGARIEQGRFEPKDPEKPPAEFDATFNGTVDYTVEPKDGVALDELGKELARLQDSEAKIDLEMKGVRFANFEAGGFPIPELKFDVLTFKGAIEAESPGQKKFSITEIKGSGPMGNLDIIGSIRLVDPLKQSGLSLQIRYTPDPETKKTLGPIIGMKLKDDGRGTYTGFLVGQLGSPQINK